MGDMTYDVVVIGGGAAGLSGALALARARRSVLVVDAGAPRNAPAGHVHNYLGREGTPPGELLAAGRAEVAGYGGEVMTGIVTSAQPLDSREDGEGFRIELADGQAVLARRLLVTTGLVDELPDVPGVAQRWGRDVLHCPYCHGWEVRDQALGVLATGPFGVHQALLFRQWSADVTLFLHTAPDLSDEQTEQLAARGIAVVAGEVAALEVTDDRLSGVRLRSGEVVAREAVVIAPRFTARAEMLTTLGLEATEQQLNGHVIGSAIAADPAGATAVAGVWVAGNVTDLRAQVIHAAAAGLNTAAAINADLIAADTRVAVAAYRHRSELGDTPATGSPGELGHAGAEQYWEGFYREREQRWSGNANPVLVDVVGALEPRTALDVGCGEGGDATWLAKLGWQVTAVDVSATVLERAAARAATAGVGEHIDLQRHDLAHSFPQGTFDLVSAQYLHSPVEFPRDQVLRAAARAVAPGGLLLIVGHAAPPPWADNHNHGPEWRFPTPEEVLEALELPPGLWRTDLAEVSARHALGPDGRSGTVTDCVVAVTRLTEPDTSQRTGQSASSSRA